MDRDLNILIDTRNRLLIESPADPLNPTYIILLIVGALGLAYLLYRLWPVSRAACFGLLVIVIVVFFLVRGNRSKSYRVDMDRSANTVTMTSFNGSDAQTPLSTISVPLSDVVHADMEFNRTARRIALSLRDNPPVHPLGPNFEYMDSQFRALGEIQKFIGQQPGPDTGQ